MSIAPVPFIPPVPVSGATAAGAAGAAPQGMMGQLGTVLQNPNLIYMLGSMGGALSPQGSPMQQLGQSTAGMAQNQLFSQMMQSAMQPAMQPQQQAQQATQPPAQQPAPQQPPSYQQSAMQPQPMQLGGAAPQANFTQGASPAPGGGFGNFALTPDMQMALMNARLQSMAFPAQQAHQAATTGYLNAQTDQLQNTDQRQLVDFQRQQYMELYRSLLDEQSKTVNFQRQIELENMKAGVQQKLLEMEMSGRMDIARMRPQAAGARGQLKEMFDPELGYNVTFRVNPDNSMERVGIGPASLVEGAIIQQNMRNQGQAQPTQQAPSTPPSVPLPSGMNVPMNRSQAPRANDSGASAPTTSRATSSNAPVKRVEDMSPPEYIEYLKKQYSVKK